MVENQAVKEIKNIELYQLIIAVMLVCGSIFGVWVNVDSRISVLETQQHSNELYQQEVKNLLKEIIDKQTTILINLENKQNKKN